VNQVPWNDILVMFGKAGLALSEAVKGSIGFLWPMSVKQSLAYAAVDILVAAAFGIGGVVLEIVGAVLRKKDAASGNYDNYESAMFCTVVGFVAFAIMLIPLSFGVLRFLNPEWYAIKDLITIVSGSN
jgi:hypothetical protein